MIIPSIFCNNLEKRIKTRKDTCVCHLCQTWESVDPSAQITPCLFEAHSLSFALFYMNKTPKFSITFGLLNGVMCAWVVSTHVEWKFNMCKNVQKRQVKNSHTHTFDKSLICMRASNRAHMHLHLYVFTLKNESKIIEIHWNFTCAFRRLSCNCTSPNCTHLHGALSLSFALFYMNKTPKFSIVFGLSNGAMRTFADSTCVKSKLEECEKSDNFHFARVNIDNHSTDSSQTFRVDSQYIYLGHITVSKCLKQNCRSWFFHPPSSIPHPPSSSPILCTSRSQ